MAYEITLDGNNRPTTFTLPLSKFQREDLRAESRWRSRQYWDSLLGDHGTPSLIAKLEVRLNQVESILGSGLTS